MWDLTNSRGIPDGDSADPVPNTSEEKEKEDDINHDENHGGDHDGHHEENHDENHEGDHDGHHDENHDEDAPMVDDPQEEENHEEEPPPPADEEEEYAPVEENDESSSFWRRKRQAQELSTHPLEGGVVQTKCGTVAAGNVLIGVAAGSEPQSPLVTREFSHQLPKIVFDDLFAFS